MGYLIVVAIKCAKQKGLDESGIRLVVNDSQNATRLHIEVLGQITVLSGTTKSIEYYEYSPLFDLGKNGEYSFEVVAILSR